MHPSLQLIAMKRGLQKVILHALGYFYFVAGINHFLTPDFYLPLIPPFFSDPQLINVLAGVAEILLGLGVLFYPTRKRSAFGILVLLACFIPSHVYFIQLGSCIPEGMCVPQWVGWIRLLFIHPVLIYWAFWVSKHDRIVN
jgi:uncharacterized membrane protein